MNGPDPVTPSPQRRGHRPRVRQSLNALLKWAHAQWVIETPTLGHAVSVMDAGGAPDMKVAAKAYLNMLRKGDGPDDWMQAACVRDEDGFYRTPLRAALAKVENPWVRRFLHDLIPNAQFRPSDIAALHGIPAWTEHWVMFECLVILEREWMAAPPPKSSWVDLSDSQRNAVVAGEAAA